MSAHLCVTLAPPGDCHRCDLERDEALPVTCDGCNARSEAGWGDTPLCIDCQRKEAPELVCEKHVLTRMPDEPCPACKALEA